MEILKHIAWAIMNGRQNSFTREIGSEITNGDITLRVVELEDYQSDCDGCYFCDLDCDNITTLGECSDDCRTDGKRIIFKLLTNKKIELTTISIAK